MDHSQLTYELMHHSLLQLTNLCSAVSPSCRLLSAAFFFLVYLLELCLWFIFVLVDSHLRITAASCIT